MFTYASLACHQLRHLCPPVGDSNELGQLPALTSLASVAVVSGGLSTPIPSLAQFPPSLSQGDITVTTAAPVSTSSVGVILSPALEPIPHRLVHRIRTGRFLEMRELLSDNIALHDQLEAIQGHTSLAVLPSTVLRTRQREVPSLVSWIYCFTAYVAVRTSDPLARDMLAYCRLLIREALRHGGQGWQEYDRTFRRQCEIDPSLAWNTLLPDLQAATMFGQQRGTGTYCILCRGADHTSQQCALAAIHQPASTSTLTSMTPPNLYRGPQRRPRFPSRSLQICASWNTGTCIYPGTCGFRHICATCSLAHRARDCPDTPEDSPFKRSGRHTPAPRAKK